MDINVDVDAIIYMVTAAALVLVLRPSLTAIVAYVVQRAPR